MFLIARGHILRADKFPWKLLDCLTVHLQADFLSPGHNHCLSDIHAIFDPYRFLIARRHILRADKFPGKLLDCPTVGFGQSLSQSPSHSPPTQAPNHSPPTQAATFRHACEQNQDFLDICPTCLGRSSGRWIGYMYRIRTTSSGNVPAGPPVIFGGSRG